MRSTRAAAILLLVAFCAPRAVHGQVPSPPAPSAPPDVVLMHSGGMVRGTIAESVPGQYVVITLTTGETRRVEWTEVRYAGAAAGAPTVVGATAPPSYGAALPAPPGGASSAPVSVPESSGGARLRFVSPQERVSFHRVTGTATATAWGAGGAIALRAHSYERLCGAPCELTLAPGSYHLALSVGGGAEVPAPPLDIRGSGTVTGTYVDNSLLRVLGWVTVIGGAAAGAAMMLAPLMSSNAFASDEWLYWLIAGGSVLIVSEVVGLILAFQGDRAVIRFD